MPNIKCFDCNGKGSLITNCKSCSNTGWYFSSTHQDNIEDFMDKAGQDLPENTEVPDRETRELRARLILEEAIETIGALGFDLHYESHGNIYKDHFVAPLCLTIIHKGGLPDEEISLEEIADGCADLSVVTIGTLSACGIADESLLDLIDENNLSKFDGKETIREDGKLIKSPNWKAPDIEGLLKKMGYQPEKI